MWSWSEAGTCWVSSRLADLGVGAVAEHEVDDAVLAAERQRRAARGGQDAQVLAAAARQHHRHDATHPILLSMARSARVPRGPGYQSNEPDTRCATPWFSSAAKSTSLPNCRLKIAA